MPPIAEHCIPFLPQSVPADDPPAPARLWKPIADSWAEAVDLGCRLFNAEPCPVCRCTLWRISPLECAACSREKQCKQAEEEYEAERRREYAERAARRRAKR